MGADRNGGKSGVERVKAALLALGLKAEIREFPASTRSAAEAAAAIGCSVAEIAKTLVFRAQPSNRAILVIASGANRVDENKLEAAIGDKIAKADVDFVRAETGFAIGGVAPIGHGRSLAVFLDADLMGYPAIWAAAGAPNSVFCLSPADLQRATGGRVLDLKN
jgi:prolyl-tRNA editing enzyme YbaK/EbsC (Cys-tRNA(Pro) deacylase)